MLVIAGAVALTGLAGLWDPDLTLDAQSNLVYADQVLSGRVPHRDFFVTYGPANYYVLAAAFALMEPSVEVQRLVALTYEAALALGVYACCARRGRSIALAAALTTVLYVSFIEVTAYAWFGGLAVTLAAVAILQRPPPAWTGAVSGALIAMSTFWRAEMLIVGLACALPFVVRSRVRFRPFVVGLGVGLVPVALYAGVAGRQWAVNMFGRAGANAGYASLDPSVIAGGAVLILAVFAMVVLGMRRADPSAIFVAVYVAVQLPQLAQRPDVLHLVFVAASSIPLAVAHIVPAGAAGAAGSPGAEDGEASGALLAPMSRLWLGGVAAIVLMSGALDAAGTPWREVEQVAVGNHSVIASKDTAPRMRHTVQALERASGGGSVFLGAQDMSKPTLTWAFFYHLMPARAADGYYLEVPPGLDLTQQERLASDVEGASVLLLTEFSDEERARLFPRLPDLSDVANDAVRRSFCRGEETPYGTVFVRC
ncbi:hypothetical protein [Oryzobacter telluris]|uniref:hypothetical protein n=1 Tax=Oryzobacter telluris TaxID=3149179 RepID=UPI00370D5AC0